MDGWRAVATGDGSWTLAHPVHGETCHSRAGAWQQARERYARGVRLAERARALATRPDRPHGTEAGVRELRLLDLGTGLGLNLAAALEALAGSGVGLSALSLELDPSVVDASIALASAQPCLEDERSRERERWHAPVRAALALARADPSRAARGIELANDGAQGRLRVLWGDARETLAGLDPAERFDAVFLDGFSPRVDPALWEPEFLSEVARRMAPGSWLATYSAAVRVRVALLAAGLRVGPGPRVAAKAEGTLASPDQAPPAFPARLARRLARRVDLLRAPSLSRIHAPGADSNPAML